MSALLSFSRPLESDASAAVWLSPHTRQNAAGREPPGPRPDELDVSDVSDVSDEFDEFDEFDDSYHPGASWNPMCQPFSGRWNG